MEMTKRVVQQTCKELGYYTTPELNEKLYLHCRGFSAIGGLEEYTGVRALFLEGNCFDEITGLDNCSELRSLYLAKNCITRLGGLSKLALLDKLDLSDNMLKSLAAEEPLTQPSPLAAVEASLTTLMLSRNLLQTTADLAGLEACSLLRCLDLSHNRIDDVGIVEFLARLPALAVLKLEGNPLVRKQMISNYRKTFTHNLPKLCCLDDNPVDQQDHDAAKAYFEGATDDEGKHLEGIEAERVVRLRHKAQKKERQAEQIRKFDEVVEQARARRRAREAKGEASPPTEYWLTNHATSTPEKRPSEGVGEMWDANVGAHPDDLERARDQLRQETLRPHPAQGPPAPTDHADWRQHDADWSSGSDWAPHEYDSSAGSDAEREDSTTRENSGDAVREDAQRAAIESAWARGDSAEYDRLMTKRDDKPEPTPIAAPISAGPAPELEVQAAEWGGVRAGCYFGTHGAVTGYYKDPRIEAVEGTFVVSAEQSAVAAGPTQHSDPSLNVWKIEEVNSVDNDTPPLPPARQTPAVGSSTGATNAVVTAAMALISCSVRFCGVQPSPDTQPETTATRERPIWAPSASTAAGVTATRHSDPCIE